jgi:hypothetical protein
VRDFSPDHPGTLTIFDILAGAYQTAGKTVDAIALYEQVLEARVKELGAGHPNTLATLNNLAAAYWSEKQFDKSIPLLEQSLAVQRKKREELHPKLRHRAKML